MNDGVPYNEEAERAVLGAVMLTADALLDSRAVLLAEHFYFPMHQKVFAAACELADCGVPVEAVTVSDKLPGVDVGVLMSMMAGTPAATNAGHYANIVREEALRRSMIIAGHEVAAIARQELPTAELVEQAQATVFRLSDDLSGGGGTKSVGDLLPAFLDDLEARANPDVVVGTPTGLVDLDRHIVALEAGTFSVVGARPAMGKSSLGLSIALNVARSGKPVVFFSLEMSSGEIMRRFASMITGIPLTTINRGELDAGGWELISRASVEVAALPLRINDDRGINPLVMRSEARRQQMHMGPLGLVVVDYLQLMSPGSAGENRQLEVAKMSRDLKRFAGDFGCPVLAMSQLSRGLESRPNKRPMLSDLRESGAIEQDADTVLFLYRDAVYNPGEAEAHDAEVIIAKNRSGPTGTVKMMWQAETTLFRSAARAGQQRRAPNQMRPDQQLAQPSQQAVF